MFKSVGKLVGTWIAATVFVVVGVVAGVDFWVAATAAGVAQAGFLEANN